jgi:membrane associated rhomboid family serine protease
MVLQAGGGDAALEAFIRAYGVVPRQIVTGRALGFAGPRLVYLTLITSMFVHAGFLHLGGNMLYLAVFGDNVEDRMGHLGYLLYYMMTGVGASLVQVVADPASAVPSVGASGAIAGVLGAYLVLFPAGLVRALVFFGFYLQLTRFPASLFLLIWFVGQFLSGVSTLGVHTAETGGIAYWAHIGGFVIGLVLVGLHRLLFRREEEY